jgi:hypothetical protein
MTRTARLCLWLVLIASLGVAAYQLLQRPVAAAPLRVGASPFVVPFTLISGEHYDVKVPVTNENHEPARLIGSLEYCGGSCVLGQRLPTLIPAGGTGYANVRIEARTPGPLDEELTFYTDRPTQPTLVIHLQGTVLEAPTHASDPNAPPDGA